MITDLIDLLQGKWNWKYVWYSLLAFSAGLIVGSDFATAPWFKPVERTVIALIIVGGLFLGWKDTRKIPKNP